MSRSRTVLVVAATSALGERMANWLQDCGCRVSLVRSYEAGKVHLEDHPDSLVTELELGAYNGLQLALRARSASIPAVIVGPPDALLQREADQLGAAYIRREDLTAERLVGAVASRPVSESSAGDEPGRTVAFVSRSEALKDIRPRRTILH